MNGKRILFSAIMTTMIGFVIGLGLAKVGQPNETQLKFDHEVALRDRAVYRSWIRSYGVWGATIGFVVGAGQEYLRQAKVERDRDN